MIHSADKPAILLVDDHPLFLEATKSLLISRLGQYEILTAENNREAETILKTQKNICLTLLDIQIRNENSLKLLKWIRKNYPKNSVIVVSGYYNPDIEREFTNAGTADFIDKNESIDGMVDKIIRCLSKQGGYNPPQTPETRDNGEQIAQNLMKLTPRQKEILKKILEGKPNKIIAAEEMISEITVKVHVSAILKTMNANNRSHLIYLLNRSNINLLNSSL